MGLGTRENKPARKQGSLRSEGVSVGGKGKGVSADPDVQTRGSVKKEVKFGSQKLWTTLFPPSSADMVLEVAASLFCLGSLRRIAKSFQWRRLSGRELSGNEDSA